MSIYRLRVRLTEVISKEKRRNEKGGIKPVLQISSSEVSIISLDICTYAGRRRRKKERGCKKCSMCSRPMESDGASQR